MSKLVTTNYPFVIFVCGRTSADGCSIQIVPRKGILSETFAGNYRLSIFYLKVRIKKKKKCILFQNNIIKFSCFFSTSHIAVTTTINKCLNITTDNIFIYCQKCKVNLGGFDKNTTHVILFNVRELLFRPLGTSTMNALPNGENTYRAMFMEATEKLDELMSNTPFNIDQYVISPCCAIGNPKNAHRALKKFPFDSPKYVTHSIPVLKCTSTLKTIQTKKETPKLPFKKPNKSIARTKKPKLAIQSRARSSSASSTLLKESPSEKIESVEQDIQPDPRFETESEFYDYNPSFTDGNPKLQVETKVKLIKCSNQNQGEINVNDLIIYEPISPPGQEEIIPNVQSFQLTSSKNTPTELLSDIYGVSTNHEILERQKPIEQSTDNICIVKPTSSRNVTPIHKPADSSEYVNIFSDTENNNALININMSPQPSTSNYLNEAYAKLVLEAVTPDENENNNQIDKIESLSPIKFDSPPYDPDIYLNAYSPSTIGLIDVSFDNVYNDRIEEHGTETRNLPDLADYLDFLD